MLPDVTFTVPGQLLTAVVVISLWSLPWKGYGLWRAAKNSHAVWFIVLLLVNTAAILEIIYIFVIDKRRGRGGVPSKEHDHERLPIDID